MKSTHINSTQNVYINPWLPVRRFILTTVFHLEQSSTWH